MSILILAILALAVVVGFGAAGVLLLASVPTSVFLRAQEHGRFAGLLAGQAAGPVDAPLIFGRHAFVAA